MQRVEAIKHDAVTDVADEIHSRVAQPLDLLVVHEVPIAHSSSELQRQVRGLLWKGQRHVKRHNLVKSSQQVRSLHATRPVDVAEASVVTTDSTQIDDACEAHQLIKVKVRKGPILRDLANALAIRRVDIPDLKMREH